MKLSDSLIKNLKKLKLIIDDIDNDVDYIIDEFYCILDTAGLNYLVVDNGAIDESSYDEEDCSAYLSNNPLDVVEDAKKVIDDLINIIHNDDVSIADIIAEDIANLVEQNL